MIQATRIQRKGVEQYEKLKSKLEQHREGYDVLKRCGREKEAKKEVLPIIEALQYDIMQLEREMHRNRVEAIKHLLKCLVSADLCTVFADNFGEVVQCISYGSMSKENNNVKNQLDILAKQFNRVVCGIDNPGNEALSLFYSDMAEECVNECDKVITGIIERWMDTEKGRQYFCG